MISDFALMLSAVTIAIREEFRVGILIQRCIRTDIGRRKIGD